MSLKENVHELNNMIMDGKLLEAFEKFYADEVTMQENSEPVRVGKDVNKIFEEQFAASVKNYTAEVIAIAYNEETEVTMIAWEWEIKFRDGTSRKTAQVSLQHWKGDKIIHERFFYNPN